MTFSVCLHLSRRGANSPARQFHKRKGFMLVTLTWGLKKPRWLGTHPDRAQAPRVKKGAHLLSSWFPFSPSPTHKHTAGTRINPREDYNKCTYQPPSDSLGPFMSSGTHHPTGIRLNELEGVNNKWIRPAASSLLILFHVLALFFLPFPFLFEHKV